MIYRPSKRVVKLYKYYFINMKLVRRWMCFVTSSCESSHHFLSNKHVAMLLFEQMPWKEKSSFIMRQLYKSEGSACNIPFPFKSF